MSLDEDVGDDDNEDVDDNKAENDDNKDDDNQDLALWRDNSTALPTEWMDNRTKLVIREHKRMWVFL